MSPEVQRYSIGCLFLAECACIAHNRFAGAHRCGDACVHCDAAPTTNLQHAAAAAAVTPRARGHSTRVAHSPPQLDAAPLPRPVSTRRARPLTTTPIAR